VNCTKKHPKRKALGCFYTKVIHTTTKGCPLWESRFGGKFEGKQKTAAPEMGERFFETILTKYS